MEVSREDAALMGMDNMIVEVFVEDWDQIAMMCIPICSIHIMPGGSLLAVFGWGRRVLQRIAIHFLTKCAPTCDTLRK